MARDVKWWCAASAEQQARIQAAGWRSWPAELGPLQAASTRKEAVAQARTQLVPRDGCGFVLNVEIDPAFASAHAAFRVEPAELEAFHGSMRTAFVEQRDYRGPVTNADFTTAEHALGLVFPATWRGYLQRASWFRAGWLHSGAYLRLLPPLESVAIADAARTLPGALDIGDDGARERLVLDLRGPVPRVMLADITCANWNDAFEQAPSIEAFLRSIEDGSFDFRFE